MSTGASRALEGRPALVTFAGIIMFMLAGFQLTFAIVEFANATWLALNVYGSFGGHLWLWGLVDTALAGVAFYAGLDILGGGRVGQVIGLVIATISAIRWFFYLPAEPWLSAVVIAVDVLIIYALVAHWDYFDQTTSVEAS